MEGIQEFTGNGIRKTLVREREEFEQELNEVQKKFRKELKMGATHTVECAWLNMPSINGARMPILEKCLQKLDEAIAKIEEGTFGICTACGKQIPPERIESVPFTAQCVSCKKETKTCLSID